jgi:hypothetical protein
MNIKILIVELTNLIMLILYAGVLYLVFKENDNSFFIAFAGGSIAIGLSVKLREFLYE